MKLRIARKIWKRAVASQEHTYTGHQIRRAVLRVMRSCNLAYKRNPRLRWRVVDMDDFKRVKELLPGMQIGYVAGAVSAAVLLNQLNNVTEIQDGTR